MSSLPIPPAIEGGAAALHRITGRAGRCGPSAIAAIAGIPTHEAAAAIRRLFGRRAVYGVFMDEVAAVLQEHGWKPDYALRHPKFGDARTYARREDAWQRLIGGVPFDRRATTLGTFLDAAPAGIWAISASRHLVAYGNGHVADSGAWFSRKPAAWWRANPDHDRVALRRIRLAVRFARASGEPRRGAQT